MGLHSSEILKKVLFSLPPGMPISTWHLKKFGISRQLAYRYVQHGWLVFPCRGKHPLLAGKERFCQMEVDFI